MPKTEWTKRVDAGDWQAIAADVNDSAVRCCRDS